MNTKLQTRLVKAYMELAKQKKFCEKLNDGTEAMPQHSALDRIEQLNKRILGQNIIDHNLSWHYCEPGTATIKYLGKVTTQKIPADIVLVGRVETQYKTYEFKVKFLAKAQYKSSVKVGVPS